jgi:hypothetical protein
MTTDSYLYIALVGHASNANVWPAGFNYSFPLGSSYSLPVSVPDFKLNNTLILAWVEMESFQRRIG